MIKIKPEDLNQSKGASKKGDACHPDSEFITEEWFREEHGIELFPLHKWQASKINLKC